MAFAARNVSSTGSPGITLKTDQAALSALQTRSAAFPARLSGMAARLGTIGLLGPSDAGAISWLPGLSAIWLIGQMDLLPGQQRTVAMTEQWLLMSTFFLRFWPEPMSPSPVE